MKTPLLLPPIAVWAAITIAGCASSARAPAPAAGGPSSPAAGSLAAQPRNAPAAPPFHGPGATPGAVPAGPPPADVTAMLAEISPERLRAHVHALAGFGTRHTLSDTESDTRGIGAARRFIKAHFERAAREAQTAGADRGADMAMTAAFDSHTYGPDGRRIDRAVDIVNVVAVLPGTMPQARDRRYYVIGHYDSRASDVMDADSDAPGANDDGSGTALVMELAEVMARHRYDATLVFMATAGEEQGLLGARLHAEAARAQGIDVRAVLSNDIVGDPGDPLGGAHPHAVRVFSDSLPGPLSDPALAERVGELRTLSATADSLSRQLARHVAMVAAWHQTPVQPMLVFRHDRFLRGGDHIAFSELGFAAVRFTEIAENYDRQHQDVRQEDGRSYGDLAEHVDAAYLAGVARVNAAALAHLANAPSAPGNARILTAALQNDTTLRWEPSPEPDVAGYEVLRRDTISPVWQHAMDVGNTTEATLPFSKDNYFFAVRAYDRDGYRSPAAFPRAARE